LRSVFILGKVKFVQTPIFESTYKLADTYFLEKSNASLCGLKPHAVRIHSIAEWKQKEEEKRIAAEKARLEEEARIAAEKARLEEERIATEKARQEEERRIKEEADRRAKEELQRIRRTQGLCQYCGGTFKGLFSQKCSNKSDDLAA
jgi:hypothetical protein